MNAVVPDRQRALTELYGELWPSTGVVAAPDADHSARWSTGLTDDEVIARACSAANAVKFGLLWDGRWGDAGYTSASEADLALVGLLAFWTGPDPIQLDRLFRQSGLFREKWDEDRGETTYGERTISTALTGRTEYYRQGRPELASPASVHRPRFIILSREALLARPDPAWLVDGILVQGSTAALVGPPASLKSFTAIDLACSVATGGEWASHAVLQGLVLYISAEGSGGLKKRILAWELEHGRLAAQLHILPEAVQLLDADEVAAVLDAIKHLAIAPVLIIVDTVNRTMAGGEENSAKDMGQYVRGVDRLREATGAAVLLIHHVNKQSGTIRGSTALPGALDTLIEAQIDGDGLTLSCSKQKDFEEFSPLRLTRKVVELSSEATSLVLVPGDLQGTSSKESTQRALGLFYEYFGKGSATNSEWRAVCEDPGKLSRATYFRARKELVAAGHLKVQGQGQASRYTLSEEALRARGDLSRIPPSRLDIMMGSVG